MKKKYATMGKDTLRIYEVQEVDRGGVFYRVVFEEAETIKYFPDLKQYHIDCGNFYRDYTEIDLLKSRQAIYVLIDDEKYWCEDNLKEMIKNDLVLSVSKRKKQDKCIYDEDIAPGAPTDFDEWHAAMNKEGAILVPYSTWKFRKAYTESFIEAMCSVMNEDKKLKKSSKSIVDNVSTMQQPQSEQRDTIDKLTDICLQILRLK